MKLHDVRDCLQITGEAGWTEEAQTAVGCPGHNPVMTVSLFLQMFKIFHNKKRVVLVFVFFFYPLHLISLVPPTVLRVLLWFHKSDPGLIFLFLTYFPGSSNAWRLGYLSLWS